MNRCEKCGAPIAPTVLVCGSCGTPVDQSWMPEGPVSTWPPEAQRRLQEKYAEMLDHMFGD